VKAAAVVVLAGLALVPAASAATPAWRGYVVANHGFKIVVPPKWYAVPRTVSAVKQTIALAKKEKKTGPAEEYSFYLTAAGQQQLKDYVFQAFLDVYPSTDPIIPQVAVEVSKPKTPYKASDLKAAAITFGSALASNKGAKVGAPKVVKLPEGTAELLTASIPVGTGLSDATQLYLLIHSGKLYVVKFDVDAAAFTKGAESVFATIAANVAWT
jgi:hypothetical protein